MRYWLEEFADDVPVLEIPTDFPRPVRQSFVGSNYRFIMDGADTGALEQLARSRGTTLFVLLTAVFNICLARISGREDIVMGTPTSGRSRRSGVTRSSTTAWSTAVRESPWNGSRPERAW